MVLQSELFLWGLTLAVCAVLYGFSVSPWLGLCVVAAAIAAFFLATVRLYTILTGQRQGVARMDFLVAGHAALLALYVFVPTSAIGYVILSGYSLGQLLGMLALGGLHGAVAAGFFVFMSVRHFRALRRARLERGIVAAGGRVVRGEEADEDEPQGPAS